MLLSKMSTEELKTAVREMRNNMRAPAERIFFQYESLTNFTDDDVQTNVYSLLQVEEELAARA